jgi:drug/metabolite transporter (DMT)-like permease
LTPRRLSPTLSGWSFAALSTLAFSLVTPVGKVVIDEGVPSSAIIVIRLVITTALLGAWLALTAPGRLRVNARALLVAVAVGLSNGVGMLTYFASLRTIDASIAAMIFSLSPLATLALLAMRGERFTWRQTVRLALGIGGVYALIGPGGAVDLGGALLAAVSIVTVPLQLVFIQWFLPEGDPQAASFYMIACMTLTALIGWGVEGAPWQTPSLSGWLAIAAITLFGTWLGRLWMFIAVQRVGSGQVGLLAPVETMLAVLWSVLFLREWLTPVQWLGGGLITLSALLAAQRLGRVDWKRFVTPRSCEER